MKKLLFVLLILLISSMSFVSCHSIPSDSSTKPIQSVEYYLPVWEGRELPSQRIEILRFHHSVECKDCATIGQFVIYLLKKEFQKECENGKIIYQSVNSDMLENKSLLDKYNVLEEDFVINVINGETEDIRHDETPFQLARNGEDLTPFLRKILKDGLAKISKS